MLTIGVGNQKGGVGKTTTAVSLGHGLAIAGNRVLIMDMDRQGHVSVMLGLEKGRGMLDFVVDQKPLAKVIKEARHNLYIVNSNKSCDAIATYLNSATSIGRERTIKKALDNDPLSEKFDVIIFDMAPSFDIIHIATLFALDLLIVPTNLAFLGAEGVGEILNTVKEVNEYGHNVDYRVLPTFFERVQKETKVQFQELSNEFGPRLWPPIPQSSKVKEGVAYGKTVWEYCATQPVVTGYTSKDGRKKFLGGYANIVGKIQNILNGQREIVR